MSATVPPTTPSLEARKELLEEEQKHAERSEELAQRRRDRLDDRVEGGLGWNAFASSTLGRAGKEMG